MGSLAIHQNTSTSSSSTASPASPRSQLEVGEGKAADVFSSPPTFLTVSEPIGAVGATSGGMREGVSTSAVSVTSGDVYPAVLAVVGPDQQLAISRERRGLGLGRVSSSFVINNIIIIIIIFLIIIIIIFFFFFIIIITIITIIIISIVVIAVRSRNGARAG